MSGLADLPVSPASERNKQPIAQALARLLRGDERVLEIGAGTGQHAVHFHQCMPGLVWQASELPQHLAMLQERLKREAPGLPNAITLDVAQSAWAVPSPDVIFTANTLHIMPWALGLALLAHAARLLPAGGLLIIYGPFRDSDEPLCASNQQFDQMLRARDPVMGIRDAVELADRALELDLQLEADLALPANNRILVFRRGAG